MFLSLFIDEAAILSRNNFHSPSIVIFQQKEENCCAQAQKRRKLNVNLFRRERKRGPSSGLV
jgi:hypothetical protein